MKLVLIFILLVLLVLFILGRLSDTMWFRIKSVMIAQKKSKEKEEREFHESIKEGTTLLSDQNRLLRIVEKIKNGEEIEIPIIAFDYIYRNINKLGVFDKNGHIKIVNNKQYEAFQNTALRLINSDEKINDDVLIDDKIDDKNESQNFQFAIQKYDDGTIVEKDSFKNSITIIKPNGKKYIQNGDSNKLIIKNIKEEEDTKNNSHDSKHEDRIEREKLKTKINILENKVNANANNIHIKKDETTIQNKNKKDENNSTEEPIIISELIDKFTQKNSKNKKRISSSEKSKNNKEFLNKNDEVISSEKEKNTLNSNTSYTEQLAKFNSLDYCEKEIMGSGLNPIRFEQNNIDLFIEQNINYSNIIDLLDYFYNWKTWDYAQYVYYNFETVKLYINIELITFKIFCLIDKRDRERFISVVVKGIDNKNSSLDFVGKVIKKLNTIMSLKYGKKPIYYNDKKNMYCIKRKVYKLENETLDTPEYFQGYFLEINLKNKVGEIIKEFDTFKKISGANVKEYLEDDKQRFNNLTFKYLHNMTIEKKV